MSVWRKVFSWEIRTFKHWLILSLIDWLIDFQMINFFFPLLHATVIRVYASKEYGFN